MDMSSILREKPSATWAPGRRQLTKGNSWEAPTSSLLGHHCDATEDTAVMFSEDSSHSDPSGACPSPALSQFISFQFSACPSDLLEGKALGQSNRNKY